MAKEIKEKVERTEKALKREYVPETIDDYYGKEMTPDDLAIICEIIPTATMLKAEPALLKTKWFDYRTTHPVLLGYLWAFYYRQAYKRFITTYRDSERGQYINGIAGKDVFGMVGKGKNMKLCTSAKAVWRARQAADKLGIPYDFYIRAVMNHAESTSWSRPPRPNQMYSEDMIAVAVNAWNIKKGTQVLVAEDNRFLAANYTGNCDQRDYQCYLIDMIKTKVHKEFSIHYCMVEKRQLLEQLAVKAFGAVAVNKAKLLSLN